VCPRVGSLAARLNHTLGMARDPDFARFWAAESISAVGSQFTAVALPLLAVLTLGASPMAVGVLTAAAGLPHLIFGLFAGAWVDRLRRRPIMIATDVGRAVLLAVIPAAAWFGVLSIELLVVVAFLAESLTVFFDIAYLAYVPTLVPRAQLVEANSKLQASASGAQVVGPALGGTLVRVLGAPFAILFDATTFLASAWFLFRIRTVEPDLARSEGLNVFQEVTQGLGILWRDRRLRALALASGVMNLGGFLFLSVYVLYLTRTLGLGPGAVGLVFALGGVGALAGSLVAGPLRAIGCRHDVDGLAGVVRGVRADDPPGGRVSPLRPAVDPGFRVPAMGDGAGFQHQLGQRAASDHARSAAGACQRHDALRRLGDAADWFGAWGLSGWTHRVAGDAGGRGRGHACGVRAAPWLADSGDAGSGGW